MSIEDKAIKFAIEAHKGQKRKVEPDKPMVFHPINVGHILKEYGFDENVVAAGFLHDVVEDTNYTFDDIKKEFGEDICSLVYGASEPDKSLSWEERKKHTIESIKDLDIRHKAVVCTDKISNLEDLYILFRKTGRVDFSSFKKGFYDQEWYYKSVYESLIQNEEEMHPMFDRYKRLIEKIFYADNINLYLKNVIFNGKQDYYEELIKLHNKKEELKKLKSLSKNIGPYVIEFTGTPRTGKTTLIDNLEDFFKKGDFSVDVLEEFTTSKKYKKEIFPTLKDQYKNVINEEIPKYVLEQLKESLSNPSDIIIIDRSLLDRLIWANRLYSKGGFTDAEYQNYEKTYIPLIKKYIDIIIGTYTDSLTSIKRDYAAHLALEDRSFLTEKNVKEYNTAFHNIESLSEENDINFNKVDTTNKSKEDVSIEVTNKILDDVRDTYIRRLIKEYKID